MARVSNNDIPDLSYDWSIDPSEGNIPFSGASVQRFIKSYLGSIAKAAHFDPSGPTMYWFKSENDRNDFIANPQRTELVLDWRELRNGDDEDITHEQ